MIRTSDVAVGDLAFRLYESGDPAAETVLFLHGSGPGATGLSNWERIIEDLGQRFHCLAPDMIGFGDSTHPLDPPRGMGPFNELRAEALLGLLDELGLDRVHLVGNSMGGQLALLMALAAPERVGKILLMGSGGAPDMPVSPGLAHLRTFYDAPSAESLESLLGEFVFDLEPMRPVIDRVVKERMAYVERADVQRSHAASFDPAGARRFFSPEELAGISHDVLVVHGRDDRIIPVAASRYFADHLPNANLFVIGRCGHWTQIEHPTTFTTLLTGLVDGVV
ncbi:alpha/beta hydrolase [Nocardioides sp. Root1257]|uniref:alpha/beta fold hydrolase n=1 Tax=unclassified Nocardioides TaxID=2615069 RepID=UPI0006F5D616|nr:MULTISPECIES: alpha/beta hydrolase [unclassified Nocardioides]KQW47397.1 alpha/beta hydrolase [Nocardioides sp. Root1257]KRC45553.1 alpha/beta hydrolase [Nocardioides sp. Root224]